MEQLILSKGDYNKVDDRALYSDGQVWLKRKDLMGKVQGYLPYVGYLTILLNDYPSLKWSLLSFMGVMVIISKDP